MLLTRDDAATKRKSRASHRARGLCQDCGHVADPNQYRCSDCKAKQKDLRLERHRARRAAGLCKYCDRLAVAATTRCETHSLKHRAHNNASNLQLKLDALAAYGSKCACTLCPDRGLHHHLFLTIDHIDGGGAEHRRKLPGSSGIYRWLKKKHYPEGFRILCWNCNAARHLNGGICPHEIIQTQA
jgi:hypothetical protein